MVLLVTKELREHTKTLEVETNIVFVGHADAAMQLNGLLRNKSPAGRELALCGAHRPHASQDVVAVHSNASLEGKRLATLHLDEHLDGPVLQRLKDANLGAELLASLEVLHTHIERALHDSLGL
jgi:hypothetical protein